MTDPARGFWSRHDLVAICETWAAVVPPSHLHVVTVPQSGASPTVLLERVCSVVGLDASTLVEQPKQANEMVGVAGTEVIRQINVRLDGRLHQRQYDRVVKAFLVRALAQSTNAARFAVPEEELGWLTKLSEETVVALQRAGYDIVGDLGDLMPRADPASRRPDDASQAELLETALDSAALLTEEFATAWWQRRKPDRPGRTNVASAARGLAFRTQRGLVHLADRNRLAAKGLGVVMARRSRAVRRRASRP
jgi:hypothetical protein